MYATYESTDRSSKRLSHDSGHISDEPAADFVRGFFSTYSLRCCIIMLIISDAVWMSLYFHEERTQVDEYPFRIPYHFTTAFSGDDLAITNPLWAGIFPPGDGAVVVDHTWAAENHFPPAQRNSSDGRAVFTITAFHQLYCITVLRTSLYQYENKRKQVNGWTDISQCLDSLRQLIMCSAEPELDGSGVLHRCRDMEALRKWTEEHAFLGKLDAANIPPQPEIDS